MGEASLAAELAGTYMTQVPEQAGARKFETRMALARAARDEQNHEQAIVQLTAAIFLQPAEAEPYVLRGDALAELCDFQSALANYRKGLQLMPVRAAEREETAARFASLLDLRAISLIDQGSYERAIELLSEAIELAPTEASLPLHRALAHAGREDHAAARADLGACLERGGASADVHFLSAKLALLAKDLPAARCAVDAALGMDAEHGLAEALCEAMRESAEVYTEEATKLVLLRRSSEAVANLTHAMALQPGNADLRVRRGGARRTLGELEGAMEDFEAAIAQVGGTYPAATRLLALTHNDLGLAAAAQQQQEEALAWFDRALSAAGQPDADRAAALANRGDCHRTCGRSAEALADYEAALELSSDRSERWRIQTKLAVVHNERGARLFNHANPRKAAVEFSRAIECNPKVAHFYTNRAEAVLRLNRFELARDDVLIALRLDPTDARAQRMLNSLCPE